MADDWKVSRLARKAFFCGIAGESNFSRATSRSRVDFAAGRKANDQRNYRYGDRGAFSAPLFGEAHERGHICVA
jgi:hypothetical protein